MVWKVPVLPTLSSAIALALFCGACSDPNVTGSSVVETTVTETSVVETTVAESSVVETNAATDMEVVTPTAEFEFGPQANAPQTVDDFLPVFAAQLKKYDEMAPQLWPDNAVVDKSVVIEDVDTNRLWLVSPDGAVAEISDSDADEMGIVRMPNAAQFSLYDDGVYVTISEADLNDEARWGKYLHLGTHDAIIWLIHEGFHAFEQPKWAELEGEVANSNRDEFLENTTARAMRDLLQRQLLLALSEPENAGLILDALATYEDWKSTYPQEYADSIYFDRAEGTAYYYEIVAALNLAFPDRINNTADLEQAITALAKQGEAVNSAYGLGLVQEGYTVGGYACLLLDRVDPTWKETIMSNPELTPIELLRENFSSEALPAPQQLSSEDLASMDQKILDRWEFLLNRKRETLTEMEGLLAALPPEARDELVAEVQNEITNLESLISERQNAN